MAAGADPSISYAYTFQLSNAAGSFLQTGSPNSASGTACSGADDCRSKCPTTDFTTDSNANVATLQQQVLCLLAHTESCKKAWVLANVLAPYQFLTWDE